MRKLVLIAAIFTLAIVACNKSKIVNVAKQEKVVLSEVQQQKLEEAFKTMPLIIKMKDEKNNRFVDFNVKERTVAFNKSWSFSNPQSNTIYAEDGYFVVYVSSSAFDFGSSTTTYAVTAGNTSLNVKTICLSIDASAYAAMFQTQTGQLPIDGISVVMGLDADFALLQNASSASFADYFHGLAYYLVYDFGASGSYNVFDWTGATPLGNSDGFAMVFSFEQNNFGGFYFSKDGTINVSGGNMTFNGNYWGIETDFTTLTTTLSYDTFAGSGTMGCE
jgi:membrane-bound inhibitor of C-type lysozyme